MIRLLDLKDHKRKGLVELEVDPIQKGGGDIIEIWVWKPKNLFRKRWEKFIKRLREAGFKWSNSTGAWICDFDRKKRKFVPSKRVD